MLRLKCEDGTQMTLDEFTAAQARTAWKYEARVNRRHRKDKPGFHVDEGVYVDQLRYHDSDGVLRGILRLYRETKAREIEPIHEWDDCDEGPGFVWVKVDPDRLRQGIGMTLMKEAFYERKWPWDPNKQAHTLAGVALARKFQDWLRKHQAQARRGPKPKIPIIWDAIAAGRGPPILEKKPHTKRTQLTALPSFVSFVSIV